MCLLCAVEIGRLTSCRQTVLVYSVSCYPKCKSDSRVRSWEIWTIFLDDFFFPLPIFFCGIWLRTLPKLGNRTLKGLFLGWPLLSCESQDSWSRFGHKPFVVLVRKLTAVCSRICVYVHTSVHKCVMVFWQSYEICVSWDLSSPSNQMDYFQPTNVCLLSTFH